MDRTEFDSVMDELKNDASSGNPAYALRSAYEWWVSGPDGRASKSGTARSRAKATGRLLQYLEDRDQFPLAAQRLSGRQWVTRQQAEHLLRKVLLLWHMESETEDPDRPICEDAAHVARRVEDLLGDIFTEATPSQGVRIPLHPEPGTTAAKFTAELCNDAECIVVASTGHVITGPGAANAYEKFVNRSIRGVLQHLAKDAVWVWYVKCGIDSEDEAIKFSDFAATVRLQGALAAFLTALQLRHEDELRTRLESCCFVAVGETLVAGDRLSKLGQVQDVSVINRAVHARIGAIPVLEKEDDAVVLARRDVNKDKENTLFLTRFVASPEPSRPVHVAYRKIAPEHDFMRTFTRIANAAIDFKHRIQTEDSSLSPSELVLLLNGICLFTVPEFVQSEWLKIK